MNFDDPISRGQQPLPFDSITCPLENCNLIEAAAGTGKTYNIQNLFIRLLLESAIPLESILVVTFTDAAAAELRERIHRILQQLHLWIQSEAEAGERFDAATQERVQRLLEHAVSVSGKNASALDAMLIRALRNFDTATISTIHGFCFKVLTENAFCSNTLFQVELVKDSQSLETEVISDFLRMHLYEQKSPHADLQRRLLSYPQFQLKPLLYLCHAHENTPHLQFYAANGWEESESYALELIQQQFDTLWGEETQLLSSLCTLRDMGTKPIYKHLDEPFFAALQQPELRTGALLVCLPYFERNFLRQNVQKRQAGALELFFQSNTAFLALEELSRRIRRYHAGVCCNLVKFFHDRMESLKQERNFQTFNDLLQRVARGLRDPETGAHLQEVLQSRYHAGIIDEFQDTDALQYEIFKNLFLKRSDPRFFMVGDPRQAIYSFRGGDLGTYLQAREECLQTQGNYYYLDTNFRSAAAMVNAVNRIFANHAQPFAHPLLGFPELKSQNTPGLLDAAQNFLEVPAALTIHRREGDGAQACLDACADEIVRLLHSSLRRPDAPERPLRPGDFAVLLFSNREAEAMQQALAQRGILAIATKRASVYTTPEAAALLLVLNAIRLNRSFMTIKKALLSLFFPYTPDAPLLRGDVEDTPVSNELTEIQERFQQLWKIWQSQGFSAMAEALLQDFAIRETLLGAPGGERSVANTLQLIDLLQEEERCRKLAPLALTLRLEHLISSAGTVATDQESAELQLESDRDAVTLSTIHKSKGLEYPIVLLPSLFVRHFEDEKYSSGLSYHREGRVEYALDNDEISAQYTRQEALQECLRLCYVAMTRAKFACHVFWGDCHRGNSKQLQHTSCLDWLFTLHEVSCAPEDAIAQMLEQAEAPIPASLSKIPLRVLQESTPANISGTPLRYTAPPAEELPLQARKFSVTIDRDFSMLSFTTLSCFAETDRTDDAPIVAAETSPPASIFHDETRDVDADEVPLETTPVPDATAIGNTTPEVPDILRIPGGASLGNAWHKLLEICDFQHPEEISPSICERILRQYGVLRGTSSGTDVVNATLQMLQQVLAQPLTVPGQFLSQPFALQEIPQEQRRNEVDFYFAIRRGFSVRDLEACVKPYQERYFPQATALPGAFRHFSGGFFRGAIDLWFLREGKLFLADWKSNRLGSKKANFLPQNLAEEMARKNYFYQYLIYTLASIHYLKLQNGKTTSFTQEDYERSFGGVFYFFLRGVDGGGTATSPNGIFYARPEWELMEQLDALLENVPFSPEAKEERC